MTVVRGYGPSTRFDDWGAGVCTETLRQLLGTCLGKGIDRAVYASALDPNHVVKVEPENTQGRFQNAAEWRVWQEVKWCAPLAKWFAPCKSISASGYVLVQERTDPVRLGELPDRVPSIFTDLKPENWGRLRSTGRIVCHDYGLYCANINPKRTRRATWSEES